MKSDKCTDFFQMFAGCENLKQVDISGFNFEEATTMAFMFNNCSSLQSVSLPHNGKADNCKTTKNMFYGCKTLTAVDFSGITTSSLEDMTQMFANCTKISEINIDSFNFSNLKNFDHAFSGCHGLSNLILPSDMNAPNLESMYNTFWECRSLRNLDLSTLKTSKNLKNLTQTFARCSNLEKLNISELDTREVTNFENLFLDDLKLKDLTVNQDGFWNTANGAYLSSMFRNCTSLTSLDNVPINLNNALYTAYMFANCSSISSLHLDTSDSPHLSSCEQMFAEMPALINLDVKGLNIKSANIAGLFKDTKLLTLTNTGNFVLNANKAGANAMPFPDGSAVKKINSGVVANPVETQLSNRDDMAGTWMRAFPIEYAYINPPETNAPALPETKYYTIDEVITIADKPKYAGYLFNGWNSALVVGDDGSLSMPVFDTDYRMNNVDGKIVVVGEWVENPPIVLPETGSKGSLLFALLGCVFVAGALGLRSLARGTH